MKWSFSISSLTLRMAAAPAQAAEAAVLEAQGQAGDLFPKTPNPVVNPRQSQFSQSRRCRRDRDFPAEG